MALQFRINDALIAQIKQCVEVKGICFLNGCGNMYLNEQDSLNKKRFTNPDQEEATYTIKFVKGDKLPNTVEELEKMLYTSRQDEVKRMNESNVQDNKNILQMPKAEVKEEIVEEPKAKGKPKAEVKE